jgi:hypothetical protein
MPGVDWQGEHGSSQMSVYDIVCLHTIAGKAPAHAAHYSVRADGHIYQSRDTWFKSAANFDGNYRVIAIENEDVGPAFEDWGMDPKRVPAFTAAQIEAIASICAWAYWTHGIPLEQCPDSRPGSRGIAYHRQGIDGAYYASGYTYGGRLPGGEKWSTKTGKSCPGDKRISQVPEIIKRARQLAGLEEIPMWLPKICKKNDHPAVYAVTPVGYFKFNTMTDANNYAFKWGLPRDAAGTAIVEVNNNIDWFGPDLNPTADPVVPPQ